MSDSGDSSEQADGQTLPLLDALRALLRPVARLLLEKQVTFPVLSELLKEVLIEVAQERFSIPGRRQTDSRLSLLTGIHRKDVKRLRQGLAQEVRVSRSASLGALLISRWMADPDYRTPGGVPVDLPRVTPPGGGKSFEGLVLSGSKDITVRSVLDEWIRLGIVELTEADVVRLRVESFVPANDFEDKVHFFGRNLRDHAAAGVHNLLEEGEPFFDRSVFYDGLSSTSLEELRRVAAETGARSLLEINRLAHELQQRDAREESGEARYRMSWGGYFFGAEEAAAARSASESESESESEKDEPRSEVEGEEESDD